MRHADLIDAFIDLRPCLKIAHHIPGRLRLRASLSASLKGHKLDAKAIEQMLLALPGVDSVRLNKLSGSAVIAYNAKQLAPDFWDLILNGEPDLVIEKLKSLFGETEAA